MIISRIHPGTVVLRNCYSGVLCSPPHHLQKRIALATIQVMERLEQSGELTAALERTLLATGKVNAPVLKDAGYLVDEFYGNFQHHTVGLYIPGEETPYQEGENLLVSMEPGIHRDIFFSMMGIKVSGVRNLPPNQYAALLAKTQSFFGDLAEVSVRDLGPQFSEALAQSRQGRVFTVSPRVLEKHSYWAHIERGFVISNSRTGGA